MRLAELERSRCPGCRPSSPGCGSRTSPTSTSACPRRRRARSSGRSTGSRSGSPTSCSSRATCSRGRRARERLRALIERLPPVYAVLGNHDYADSRDPFSKPVGEVDLGRGTLLADEAVTLELRGRRVQLVGVDPRTYMRLEARPWELADPDADLRILLCHFPRDRRPAAGGRVRPRPLRPHARRPDLPAVRRRQGAARASAGAVQPRRLPAPGGRAARLARARDDVRAVPVLRAAGGDGAAPTIRVMEGHASISPDVLARYAAMRRSRSRACTGWSRATCRGIGPCGSRSPRTDGLGRAARRARVGRAVREVGRAVQERVAEYLARMADLRPARVDVVVDEIGPVRA